MRIALVGPSTAGKSTLARQLAEFVGRDQADFIDHDEVVAAKWQLRPPGLYRLWLMDQANLPEKDRGMTPNQLLDREESELQDCLDSLSPGRITIIALRSHAFRCNAENFPDDPRKQWWDRFVEDTTQAEKQTYVLRLNVTAEVVYERLKSRFAQHCSDHPDMAESFSKWAEITLWSDGVLIPRRQAIKDLTRNQIVELVPHYWQFPYLATNDPGRHVTPEEALQALGLPTKREELLAMLPAARDKKVSLQAEMTACTA